MVLISFSVKLYLILNSYRRYAAAELQRLRALGAIGRGDASPATIRVLQNERRMSAGGDFAYGLVERIASAVTVALGRPKVSARELVAECLVLFYLLVAHKNGRFRP